MSAILTEIETFLVAEGLVNGGTGWTLKKGFMPNTPAKMVAIYETPGPAPEVSDDDETDTNATVYDFPHIQIKVRGAKQDYTGPSDKIHAIRKSLHKATIAGYAYVFAMHSGPMPLGRDKSERNSFTWNFETMRQTPA